MRLRFFFFGLIVIGVGLLLVLSGHPAVAQTDTPTPQPLENAISDAGIQQVVIPNSLTSFVVSNPFCYQPDPSVDQCRVNFRYIQANDNQSSAPYMTWLAITILGKKRFNATAFFEGTIYYSYDMAPGGFSGALRGAKRGRGGNRLRECLWGDNPAPGFQPQSNEHGYCQCDLPGVRSIIRVHGNAYIPSALFVAYSKPAAGFDRRVCRGGAHRRVDYDCIQSLLRPVHDRIWRL